MRGGAHLRVRTDLPRNDDVRHHVREFHVRRNDHMRGHHDLRGIDYVPRCLHLPWFRDLLRDVHVSCHTDMYGRVNLCRFPDLYRDEYMPRHQYVRCPVQSDDARKCNVCGSNHLPGIHHLPGYVHLSRSAHVSWLRDMRGNDHVSRDADLRRS